MKADQSRPVGKDAEANRGTIKAINEALGLTHNELLIDRVADAAFASMIERLRGEPGSNNGGKQ